MINDFLTGRAREQIQNDGVTVHHFLMVRLRGQSNGIPQCAAVKARFLRNDGEGPYGNPMTAAVRTGFQEHKVVAEICVIYLVHNVTVYPVEASIGFDSTFERDFL